MNLKLIVAILAIAAVPVGAHAQKPGAAKVTNADAQKVVKIISGDKAKTQTYCELSKLGEQIEQAEQKNDSKTADALSQKADALAEKLGPEYAALMDGLQTLDQNSKDGDAIGKTFEDLDKLCAK
jgi:prephenate dehydratase